MSASSTEARRHDRLARFFELQRSRGTKTDLGDVEQTFFDCNRAGLEALGVVSTERSRAKKCIKKHELREPTQSASKAVASRTSGAGDTGGVTEMLCIS